jgi:hypothetical protein
MTTESTQPQTELGPAPANGPAQSQGHRRRRRRRKNKTSQAGTAPVQQQGASAPPAPAQPAPPPPVVEAKAAPTRAAHQGQQGQGRKKKKFFTKGSAPAAQPGNNASYAAQGSAQGPGPGNGGAAKRKTRQKGPREFVGPMDHSYRIVNGNVADGPPSTIQMGSNGHSSHYQDNFTPQPTIPVKENAPTRIFCFIEDLFFLAKIQETARKLGVKVEFVKGDKESVAKITDLPEAERPGLVVFDLNNLNAKPITLIPKLKSKLKKATSIIGFLNHLQGDLKMKAIEAGCDTVMPRSAFSQSLPNLLRRYGLEEEEDYAQQPL